MIDTTTGPQPMKNEVDAKTTEERRHYKRAGIQKEGRTVKAYQHQSAPLKWPCPICTPRAPQKRTAKALLEASFPSKESLEGHCRSQHNRELAKADE